MLGPMLGPMCGLCNASLQSLHRLAPLEFMSTVWVNGEPAGLTASLTESLLPRSALRLPHPVRRCFVSNPLINVCSCRGCCMLLQSECPGWRVCGLDTTRVETRSEEQLSLTRLRCPNPLHTVRYTRPHEIGPNTHGINT